MYQANYLPSYLISQTGIRNTITSQLVLQYTATLGKYLVCEPNHGDLIVTALGPSAEIQKSTPSLTRLSPNAGLTTKVT